MPAPAGKMRRSDDLPPPRLRLRGFASDNYAGMHPEVLAAIAAANDGHQVAYGEDLYTARLQEVIAGTSARASRRSRCSTARGRTSRRCSRCCRAGAR